MNRSEHQTFHRSYYRQGTITVLLTLLFMSITLAGGIANVIHVPAALSATITVCATGCNHTTIAAAIAAATAGDTLDLAAETFTEVGITVNKDLTISGVTASSTIVQAHATAGSAAGRVFNISSGFTVTFENLTIRHGYADFAGGIDNQGTLTINNCIVSNNTVATSTNTGGGGGVYSGGDLTINNSTFMSNTVTTGSSGGGAIRYASFSGSLTINNSTFSGNSANAGNSPGGAIRMNGGTTEINNSTFSGNSTSISWSGGGAIYHNAGSLTIRNSTFSDNTIGGSGVILHKNGGTLHLINTIIANSTGDACGNDTNGDFSFNASDGAMGTDTNNLIEGTSNCGTPVSTADPMLGPLANNGGDTQTHALQIGSPAFNAGDNAAASALTTDQRGSGFARVLGGTVDIGAYELIPPVPEIGLLGNGTVITDGATLPTMGNGTDFGSSLLGIPVTQTFTISNSGSTTLTLSLPITVATANATNFAVTSAPGISIASNGIATFQVTFTPTVGGLVTATIEIGNDDSDEDPYNFVIQGTGLAPEIAVLGNGTVITDGATLPTMGNGTDFGSSLPGTPVTQTFTISNSGNATLTLSLPITVTTANAANFAVTSAPGITIAANGTATFQVTFTPTVGGLVTATIEIGNDDSDEHPYNFVIQGTGLVPEIAVLGNGTVITDGATLPTMGNGTDFGNSPLGIPVMQTFTISNSGNATLTLSLPITVTTANAANFAVTSAPGITIAANGTATFQVTFTPTVAGLVTAIIEIGNNDSDEHPYNFVIQGTGIVPEIAVLGNGTVISDGATLPTMGNGTDFGSSPLGTPVMQTFTISNSGDAPLTLNLPITVTTANAANFAVTSGPVASIAANGSATFQVTFIPTVAGLATATIEIGNNDSDEHPYNFVIQGTGFSAVPPIPTATNTPTHTPSPTATNTPTSTPTPSAFVSLSQAVQVHSEGVGTISLLLQLGRPLGVSINVTLGTLIQQPDYATAFIDYTLANSTVTFLPGEVSQDILITINQDTVVEPNEQFQVIINQVDGGVMIAPNGSQVLVTILDDDIFTATPTVTITPTETDIPTSTATSTPTETPVDTATSTATSTMMPTATPLPTETALPTATPTLTETPTDTTTPLPTATAMQLPTETTVPTVVPTDVPTATAIPTDTSVPTAMPTATAIPVSTVTPLPTTTTQPTATALSQPEDTATAIPTETSTSIFTETPTVIFTVTATETATATVIPTDTSTAVPTATTMPTAMPTVTEIVTEAATEIATETATVIPTEMPTNTSIPPTAVNTNTPTATATNLPTRISRPVATPRPGINLGFNLALDTVIIPGLSMPTVIIFDSFTFSQEPGNPSFIVIQLARFTFVSSPYFWFNVPMGVSAASVSQEERTPCTAESVQCALALDGLTEEEQTDVLNDGVPVTLNVAEDVEDGDEITLELSLVDEDLQPLASSEAVQTEISLNTTVNMSLDSLPEEIALIPLTPTSLDTTEDPSQPDRWFSFLPLISR